MTWTPSTPSLPPGSGRPTPTSARSTGSSPPPTPESSSATYTQTLRGDGLLGARELPGDYFRRSGGLPTHPGAPPGHLTSLTIEVKFGEAVPANDRTKTNSAAPSALVSVPERTASAVRHARCCLT